jgi:hypothetical protein
VSEPIPPGPAGRRHANIMNRNSRWVVARRGRSLKATDFPWKGTVLTELSRRPRYLVPAICCPSLLISATEPGRVPVHA